MIVNQDEKGTTSKWTAGQYYTDYGSKKAKKKATEALGPERDA